jgi:hypothetical protein
MAPILAIVSSLLILLPLGTVLAASFSQALAFEVTFIGLAIFDRSAKNPFEASYGFINACNYGLYLCDHAGKGVFTA